KGAEYVTSRSLQSSTVYLGGSKRWSRNDRLMVSEKSSIGDISSKISASPDFVETSVRPAASWASTSAFQTSSPISQEKLSVCSDSNSGTSSGSSILANEIRRGGICAAGVCEAAKRVPFRAREAGFWSSDKFVRGHSMWQRCDGHAHISCRVLCCCITTVLGYCIGAIVLGRLSCRVRTPKTPRQIVPVSLATRLGLTIRGTDAARKYLV